MFWPGTRGGSRNKLDGNKRGPRTACPRSRKDPGNDGTPGPVTAIYHVISVLR